MALLVEVRKVVHHTLHPSMQVVDVAIFKMLVISKDFMVVEMLAIGVEASKPMQALKEAVESALVLVTVVLPYVLIVMLQLEVSLKPNYLSKKKRIE